MGSKRRANGTGSITFHKSLKLYMGRYHDRDGKRRTLYGKSHDEAHRKLIAAQQLSYDGVLIAGDKLDVETFLKEWLETTKPNLRFRTWKRYVELCEIHLIPELGDISLSRLHPRDLRSAYARRLKHVSASTVGHAHRVLHAALAQAARDDLVPRNVASLVSPPKVERTEMEVFSEHELNQIINASAGHRFAAVWALAIATAARAGEIFGATWRNLDLDAGIWRIETSLQRSPEGLTLLPPKTNRGRRTVLLGPSVISKLQHHRAMQDQEKLALGPAYDNSLDLVFTDAAGKPIDPSNFVRRYHYPLLADVGLAKRSFHTLRHSTISLMLAKNVPVPEVSAIAGHANSAVTMSIYAHAQPGTGDKAVAAMKMVLGA